MVRAFVALVVCGAVFGTCAIRYRLVRDWTIGEHCLAFGWYLVDLGNRTVGRGDYVVFLSRETEPFYPSGTRMLKRVVGVYGDSVRVGHDGVFVNGRFEGGLIHAQPGGRLWKLGKGLEAFSRDEQVPPGKLWVMGTHERSYDSRYWGYVSTEQVVGRAWPIW